MKKAIKITFIGLIAIAVMTAFALFMLKANIPVYDPKGIIGQRQKELLNFATWMMLIVVIPTFFFAIFIPWKFHAGSKKAKYDPEWNHSHIAEVIWWGVPCIIIAIISYVTWKSCYELDPYRPIASDNKTMYVEVVAMDWKWLFIYPEQKIAAVNYVQFPANTPIKFHITADAPMNSFWIPQLGGQIFAMAGMRTELHLIAEEIGAYRGCSANISGVGFSGMTFTANATSQEDFDKWVLETQNSSRSLDLSSYAELVKPSSYVPVSTYRLAKDDLFEWVIMKYMMPMDKE